MKTVELLDLVKNKPDRGATWTLVKGNRPPGKKQIELMNKYDLILDIDPKIRNLVIDLNEMGFKTYGSCAGHNPKKRQGFVTIVKHKTLSFLESKKQIRNLCKKHGIFKVIFFDKKEYACKDGKNMFAIEFESLGNFFII